MLLQPEMLENVLLEVLRGDVHREQGLAHRALLESGKQGIQK